MSYTTCVGARTKRQLQAGSVYTRLCIFTALLFTFFFLAFPSVARAATLTATWSPNPEPNIAGYQLLVGTASGSYTMVIDVGKVTSYSFSVTAGTTYYCVLQAYNTAGLYSPYSAEVVASVPAQTGGSDSGGGSSGASGGSSGGASGGGGGTSAGGGLPGPWLSQDVGNVGWTGSSSYNGAAFTVQGAGADIWGTADAFQFTFQPLSGDGLIIARANSLQNTSGSAKAGVMFRDSLTAGAANVILDVEPSGNIEFMARSATGRSTTWLAGASGLPPTWLALWRNGSTISAFVSADGNSWTSVGGATISLSTTAYVGLAVTSHNASQLNTATFDQVSVRAGTCDSCGGGGLPSGWQSQDVGNVGITGSASISGNGLTLRGAGADIWGNADAFQFAYRTQTGNDYFMARVTSIQYTNPSAKAGVMIRSSTDPGAASVIVNVKPDGGIEFMARSWQGGPTTWYGGLATSGPAWVGLVRSGSTVSAYAAQDGNPWAYLGTVNVDLPATVLGGLAVTSHDASQLNTATFDGVH